MSDALEKKISDALSNNNNLASADLSNLVTETEAAIIAADQAAEAEHARALDPALSPDPVQARAAMEDAAFSRDRLKTLLPRLKHRYQQVADQETYDSWAAEFDQFLPRYNAAVAQLKTVCEEYEAKIVATLVEAQAVDAEVRRFARSKPHHLLQANNDGRDLPEVELAARGLSGVAPGCSFVKDMKLPAFAEPNRLAWPPPQPLSGVEVALALSASIPRHPGSDWWKEIEQRDRAIAAESRERTAREKVEREQRFKEKQEREHAADEQQRIERHRTLGWPV
jgi:hypothetical protein